MPDAPHLILDHELGSGTSGRVWRGRLAAPFDGLAAQTEVAVKVAHEHRLEDATRAFLVEGQVGRAVQHPHLVRVAYAGPSEHGPIVVTRFVEGESLRRRPGPTAARPEPLPEPRVRIIGGDLAGALAALHATGWVHADIKPENVRLDAERRAVLLDFGLARRTVGGEDDARRPGSLPYLAPELLAGSAPSEASDVFALGVTLYELATSMHPFLGAHPLGSVSGASEPDEAAARIRSGRVEPPSAHVPVISPLMDELLGAMLSRDPADRPSASEVAEVLATGEAGAWWRERIAFHAGARRGRAAWSGRALLPLVGRERELARLDAASKAAHRESHGAALWLVGDPGSGKTRLANEFAARARASVDPPLFLYGRCAPFEEERPGQPVLTLLRRWLQLPPGAVSGRRERAVLERLTSSAVTESLLASLAPTRLGEHSEAAPMSDASALADWLLRLGRAGPLILCLDDLHLADAATLDTLRILVDGMEGTRLLLLLCAQRGESPLAEAAFHGLRMRVEASTRDATIELEALTQDDVLQAVEAVFHNTAPRLRLAKVLTARSRGNLGLMEELLSTLATRLQTRPHPDGGGLELLIAPEQLPHPESLARSIAERFRALPATERSWLQRLAVVGGRLESAFLARAFPPLERNAIEELLEELVRKGWLAPSGARYRFVQPAERRAVYRSTSRARRAHIHARAAHALSSHAGEARTLGVQYQRAYHLRAAGAHDELLSALVPLLDPLLSGGHPGRVRTLATWGLDAIDALTASPDRDRLRIRLLEAAADAADRLGSREEQRLLLDRLSDLELDPDQDPKAVGCVYLLHARYASGVGQYGLARGMLHGALIAFEKSGDREFESDAAQRLALVQGDAGEAAAARELARRALDVAPSPRLRALAHLALATDHIRANTNEAALREIGLAIDELRAAGGDAQVNSALATAHLLRSRTFRSVGRPRRALAAILRARRLASRSGERLLEVESQARHGRLLIDLGREREAELVLRDASLLASEIEDRRGAALTAVFLGTLLAEEGESEGGAQLARASELARGMGLPQIEALCFALRARVAHGAADPALALTLSERAMKGLEQHGAELPDRVVITATRSMILAKVGRDDEAKSLLRDLGRDLRRAGAAIETPTLRRRQRVSIQALLETARSPVGPVYPRLQPAD